MVTVFLAQALICVGAQCFPALVGDTTPTGVFPLVPVQVRGHEYMQAMAFAQDEAGRYFAVHTVPRGATRRHRLLARGGATGVTNGCINVGAAVFQHLKGATQITIRR